MNDRDRQTLTEIFESLYQEINRNYLDKDYELEYKRLIIRELGKATQATMLKLQMRTIK